MSKQKMFLAMVVAVFLAGQWLSVSSAPQQGSGFVWPEARRGAAQPGGHWQGGVGAVANQSHVLRPALERRKTIGRLEKDGC